MSSGKDDRNQTVIGVIEYHDFLNTIAVDNLDGNGKDSFQNRINHPKWLKIRMHECNVICYGVINTESITSEDIRTIREYTVRCVHHQRVSEAV